MYYIDLIQYTMTVVKIDIAGNSVIQCHQYANQQAVTVT